MAHSPCAPRDQQELDGIVVAELVASLQSGLQKLQAEFNRIVSEQHPEGGPPDEKQELRAKLTPECTTLADTTQGQLVTVRRIVQTSDGEAADPRSPELCELLLNSAVLLPAATLTAIFDDTGRKAVQQLYGTLILQRRAEFLAHIEANPAILTTLVSGYQNQATASTCGNILRDMIRVKELARMLLSTPALFDPFFQHVQHNRFEIASDSFATLKALLTKHPDMVMDQLTPKANWKQFVSHYLTLIQSPSYICQRQSLKFLGEFLVQRAHFKLMMRFLGSANNLTAIVNQLMGAAQKQVKIEAFHVFKLFVGNPRKKPAVVDMLVSQREDISAAISLLKPKRGRTDEGFETEKADIIAALASIEPPLPAPTA